MSNYRDLTEMMLHGCTCAQAASNLGVSQSRVRAMVLRLKKEGIEVSFRSNRADLSGALAVYKEHLAESTPAKAPAAPKLTKAQEEARAITLRALREMYNEPEGTYEELNARLQASAPPTAHEAPEPDGWGDDEAKRIIAELEAPSAPPQPSPAVAAKLDDLFKEE